MEVNGALSSHVETVVVLMSFFFNFDGERIRKASDLSHLANADYDFVIKGKSCY